MALNIDLDVLGFLSDSDSPSVSPKIKQQSPISPIESESSSGISSLDSDDLKKQLMSSPSISQEDEEPQSDGGIASVDDETPKETEEEGEEEEGGEQDEKEEASEVAIEPQAKAIEIEEPIRVVYQKRDVLDLFGNIGSGKLTQYTALPENNLNCFFLNRSQYWRLSKADDQSGNQQEKCPCCDFTYPLTHHPINEGPKAFPKGDANANPITASIMTFLKSTNEHLTPSPSPYNFNSAKRFVSQFSTSTQYGYQMQPQLSPPQLYHPLNNGYSNNYAGNYSQQQMNQQYMPTATTTTNNNNFGSTLALLSMMNNASKNAASAFQSLTGNNSRGYKQF